jgi:hypothetical protein
MKKYNLKTQSESRRVADERRATVAQSLSLGAWSGGEITSHAELAGALVAEAEATKVLRRFKTAAKAWVDEHGPVTADDGRTWGPSEVQRVAKVNLALGELIDLLADCGVPANFRAKVKNALKRRGIGETSRSTRYAWSK